MSAQKRPRKRSYKTPSRQKKSTMREPTATKLSLPDMSILQSIDPFSEQSVQPSWIRERHPEYVDDHELHHSLTSVRAFTHAGHHVKITTSYQIEIDGTPVWFHALVDNEGRLRCHTTPYETYASATELVKKLIDRFPKSFADLGGGHFAHHG